MYKHPISAFFRLLPTLSWLAVCAIALVASLEFYPHLLSDGRWTDTPKTWVVVLVLGFIAVAVYAARRAHKEYKEALPVLRADMPIRLGGLLPRRRAQPFTPTRYPLPDSVRAELRRLIETLLNAGMLAPGEVLMDEVIDCAETFDDWSKVDLYMAMNVLHVLHNERQRPFANLAFFPSHFESDESDAVNIVRELVRLCGRTQELSAVRVRPVDGVVIVPPSNGSSLANAVAEFDLGTEHHAVPFVLYPKSLPGGLIEALAKILISGADLRRFVWDYFDSFFSVSYLTPAQTAAVNSAEQEQIPRFVEVRDQV